MARKGPIILIEDDTEDQEIMKLVHQSLSIPNKMIIFDDGQAALNFLRMTTEQPFLILSDINMPKLTGLQLRRKINEDENLRRKCIPFIFLTTAANKHEVVEAYDLTVQGFFVKNPSFEALQQSIKLLVDYWKSCVHPNTL